MTQVMPNLTDADCIAIYRKRDIVNRVAADMGLERPVFGEPYVTDFIVNDGLGYDLESRQYVRIGGKAYRVREWHCGLHMDGYRFTVERVYEPHGSGRASHSGVSMPSAEPYP
jgi:hypothetical protein